jgi:hypothetical protein
MSRMMLARVVLAVIGVIIWGYGTATDDANIRLAGIGCLSVSLLLRFAPKDKSPPPDDRTT